MMSSQLNASYGPCGQNIQNQYYKYSNNCPRESCNRKKRKGKESTVNRKRIENRTRIHLIVTTNTQTIETCDRHIKKDPEPGKVVPFRVAAERFWFSNLIECIQCYIYTRYIYRYTSSCESHCCNENKRLQRLQFGT